MVAALVPEGAVIADIGTDHAYLPCYLVGRGSCPAAFACDVVPGPLENAVGTVNKYGLSDAIRCLLSDGTRELPPAGYDTLVCAGMGGELICDILRSTEDLNAKTLVLQPMTHSEDLRAFLCKNGFTISGETAVCDGKRTYIAFSASFTGDDSRADDRFYHYFGSHLLTKDAAASRYIRKQIKHLSDRRRGLEHSEKAEDRAMLAEVCAILNDERLRDYL